ncbi:fucolectin-7-like, partial [Saccoglossus kowalevskii]|uniref:Fucolectin-7-like n=1 Tax=Saccoglossus kowalevskii TaxID=10224 RepID=A0ABM0M3D0_SACKO
ERRCNESDLCHGATCNQHEDSSYTCDCNSGGFIENVAIGRLVRQSSTSHGGLAPRAVDGNTNPIYYSDTCSHAGFGDMFPWWRVDLAFPHCIQKVRIYNRLDCC